MRRGRAGAAVGRGVLARLEPMLVGFFAACWLAAGLHGLGLASFAGRLALSLYGLYSLAAGLGWMAGNAFVHRSRAMRRELGGRLGAPAFLARFGTYFLGPLGLVFLLRAMAPAVAQQAAPLVPLYAVGVFGALFLVPVLLPPRRPPRPPRIGG